MQNNNDGADGRQGGAVAEQLLAALRGAASVAHSSSNEGDVRMLPLPEFKGEATHYQSWWNVVEATLDLYGLLDVVEKGVAGQEKCASVIGAQADEVQEAAQPSGASAGGVSTSSGLAGATNERKAKKAFVLILSAIKSVEVLGLLADVPRGNAFELRRRLKEYYTRSNEVSKHQLLGEFYRLSQRGDESVALFSARVKAVVLTLKSIGESVSASAMQHAFISGLHGNYQHLRASLSIMGAKMSFEETVAAALMQEAQAEKDIDGGGPGGARRQAHAYHAATREGDGACWRCGIKGHMKMECKNPPQTCSYCLKKGHAANDCHKRARDGASDPDDKKPAVALSAETVHVLAY